MNIFDKIKDMLAGEYGANPEAKASASEYVEWLASHMLRSSKTTLRLDSAHRLPADKDAPAIPEAEAVINRLKVMCGINPFRLSDPIEGEFHQFRSNCKVLFKTRFEDRGERSICELQLVIRATS